MSTPTKKMKQTAMANWNVPNAASKVVLPSLINGATQLMFVTRKPYE